MAIEELRAAFLTKDLTDEQLRELVAAGREVTFREGEVLFREGEPADFLVILLDGRVELTRRSGSDTIALATMSTPGQWAGGLRAWGGGSDSAGFRATGTATSDGRAFEVPSEDLSRLVGEWFPFGKHIITGLFQTVRTIEATARQRDSLVALGTLAAGLAHEINNPAAASLRAVEELRATCDAMLSSLTNLAEQLITADEFVALDGLRRDLASRPAPEGDALDVMDREAELEAWLERAGVERAWDLAPVFAATGADVGWFEQVQKVVGPATGAALGWAATTLNATSLLADLTDTTNRISNLVGAVRSYSQLDRTARQRVDLREGIESTLVMLSPKLTGIEVVREFDPDVPPVEVFAGELNQVWTNLVDNAVDAMDGEGTLRISTRLDGEHVVVDIADTGRGMDATVQERAFEPFFTTKDVGKGTGLGLDISRRIVVERHGGDITFDSRPGSTVAHVRLPLH